MTTYTIRTNRYEAEQIMRGNKMYVLRSDKVDYKLGGVAEFLVIEDTKPVKHAIEDSRYIISSIERGDPIRDGIVLLGIKKL